MNLSHYSEGAKAILDKGGAFELQSANINGIDLPVFATAPASLRQLYLDALKHSGNKIPL